jgi:lipoprotein-anchoring transpeptidase ErfK/SrfK
MPVLRLVSVVVLGLCVDAIPAFATQNSDGETTTTTTTQPALTLPGFTQNLSETRRFAPLLPRNSGDGRRVVYSNSLQWVWVVDKSEQVIRSMPVSGRRGVPTPGTYKVTSQSAWSYSLDFEGVDFRWMTRFAKGPDGGNIGFHEIPRKDGKLMQSYSQLGSFAGSGCVRMATEDVKFIYRWARPGTQVVVTR